MIKLTRDYHQILAEIDEIIKKFDIVLQPRTAEIDNSNIVASSTDERLAEFRQCVPEESKEKLASTEVKDYEYHMAITESFDNDDEVSTNKQIILAESIPTPEAKETIKESGQQPHSKPIRKHRHFSIKSFLYYGLLIAIVVMAYFVGNTTKNQPRTVFGYSVFTVLTGSMRSEIPEGSLIITKYTDPNQIQVGDDITYLREDLSTVTHRVVEIYENYNNSGVRGFRTKGIDNPMVDTFIIHPNNILGVVVFHVAGVGAFLVYVQQNPLLIVLIGIILIALVYTIRYICWNRKSRRKFKSKMI